MQPQFPLDPVARRVVDAHERIVAVCGCTHFTPMQAAQNARRLAAACNLTEGYVGHVAPRLLQDCLTTLAMVLYGAPQTQLLASASAMLAAAYDGLALADQPLAREEVRDALVQERAMHNAQVQYLIDRDSQRRAASNRMIARMRQYADTLEIGEEIRVRVLADNQQTREVAWRKDGTQIVEYEREIVEPAGHPEAPVAADQEARTGHDPDGAA